jgi:hypothetical protein
LLRVKGLQKKTVSLIVLVMMFCSQLLFPSSYASASESSVSNVPDTEFFGVWNAATGKWTTPSKLNYADYPGLSSVQTNVKSGNYKLAKTDLLNYFKNRTIRTAPTDFVSKPALVPLLMDQIIPQLKEHYVTTFTVSHTLATNNIDVLTSVKDTLGSKVSFTLMGRYKGTNRANLYSRDQVCTQTQLAQCQPTLTIQYTDETGPHTADFITEMDTYIRGNDDTTHGSDSLLQVQESGAPYDSDTRKAYLKFDLTSIKGTVTGAALKLSGYTEASGNSDVMLFKLGDTSWDENTLIYANHNGQTFSWQGIPSGTDWTGPPEPIANFAYYGFINFDWVKPLLAEYVSTGNESYAAKYIDYMVDFIRDGDSTLLPLSHRGKGAGSFPKLSDAAVRSSNWVNAYNVLRTSTSMNAEANTDILKTFWKKGDYLSHDRLTVGNRAIMGAGGLYAVAVYFPEFTDAAAWLTQAYSDLTFLISTMNLSDGSYMESSDFYPSVAVGPFMDIRKFGTMNGESFTPSLDQTLHQIVKYQADMYFPNGYSTNFGDSQYVNFKPYFKEMGDLFDDDNLRYLGTSGAEGTPPAYTSVLYPAGKLAIMRSGWTPNDRYLFTNVKPETPHRHPDDNAITYYAYGRPLLVDPGSYTYTNEPVSNWLRFSTEAHNTIEIDDTAQNLTSGSIRDWTDNSKFNFVNGVTQNVPGFTHSRETLFLKSSFSIVSDYVQSPMGTHKYQQTWHFLPEANPTLDSATKRVSTVFNDTYGNIQVVPADPDQFAATLDNGYYSNVFYTVADATYASYTKNVSGDTTFDTILYPTASGDNRDIKVSRLAITPVVPTTVASALKIDDIGETGTTGYYYLSHEEIPMNYRGFDTFQFDGKMAYVEKKSSGTLKSAMLKSGTTLKNNHGSDIIRSRMTISDMAVDWNGTALDISGSNIISANDQNDASAIAIYAPGVTTVKLNGNTLSNFTVSGDYIYAVGIPSWTSSHTLTSKDLGTGNSGVQTMEFDLLPTAMMSGSTIGYTGQSAPVSSTADLPIQLSLDTNGYFAAWNGSAWQPSTLQYNANQQYHITVNANLFTKTYNMYVGTRGRAEVQIADRFAFKTGTTAISDIGQLVMNSPTDGQFNMANHSVREAAYYRVNVEADAGVKKGIPSSTSGTSNVMQLYNDPNNIFRNAFLRFNLADLPHNTEPEFANLQLTSAETGTFTDQAQVVNNDSWDESTINYTNMPTEFGPVFASWNMPAIDQSVYIDVADQVKAELTGDKKLSLMLSTQTKNKIYHYYYAKEKGSQFANILVYPKHTSSASEDITPPVTSDDAKSEWQRSEQTILLTASDTGSGVKSTFYSVDNVNFTEGNTVVIQDEGVHTIKYYSEDEAGNKEQVKSVEVKIDLTAPVVHTSAVLPSTVTIAVYQTDAVNVPITITDALSGLAGAQVTLDGNTVDQNITVAPFSLVLGDHDIAIRAEDLAGHVTEQHYVLSVQMDIDHLDEAVQYAAGNGWITNHGITNSLLSKIGNIQKHADDANQILNGLNALENEVQAQSGNKIDASFARMLLADIAYLRNHN